MTIKFNKRVVDSGYVIAVINNDDSLPYMGKNDPCLYLADSNDPSKWTDFYGARVFPNEAALANSLERVKRETADAPAMPIFWETTITSVDSESFGEHIRQTKIAKALAKLNEEDIVVLGLTGEKE